MVRSRQRNYTTLIPPRLMTFCNTPEDRGGICAAGWGDDNIVRVGINYKFDRTGAIAAKY